MLDDLDKLSRSYKEISFWCVGGVARQRAQLPVVAQFPVIYINVCTTF